MDSFSWRILFKVFGLPHIPKYSQCPPELNKKCNEQLHVRRQEKLCFFGPLRHKDIRLLLGITTIIKTMLFIIFLDSWETIIMNISKQLIYLSCTFSNFFYKLVLQLSCDKIYSSWLWLSSEKKIQLHYSLLHAKQYWQTGLQEQFLWLHRQSIRYLDLLEVSDEFIENVFSGFHTPVILIEFEFIQNTTY